MVVLTNRNFDYVVGKVTYYIRVSADSMCLISKDGHSLHFLGHIYFDAGKGDVVLSAPARKHECHGRAWQTSAYTVHAQS
ncbi:hypothetical protein TELCIR_04897 [Teladorsagia circumcincta]|uniref:Uncharacterized protein n=1 Tax=Teladorsagia circumcincta TaxID=45464 RepID=A0A2G9UUF7_TELCI|nr:hypothetical protein TELCIR_04897 [Teladorsagia circumcincta]